MGNSNEIRCSDILSDDYVSTMSKRVRKLRCFFVQMEPTFENISEPAHRKAFETFFAPAFQRSGSCIIAGADPADIAAAESGLTVQRSGIGWSISKESSFDGTFPYWKYEAADRLNYRILMTLDVEKHASWLTWLLSETWDPKWFNNPQAIIGPEVLHYAKTLSNRSEVTCLSYGPNPSRMDIGIVASSTNSEQLYGIAARRGRAKYTVPLSSEDLRHMSASWTRSRTTAHR